MQDARHLPVRLLVALLAVTLLPLLATAEPKVGERAPPLGVEALLNAPADASAEWDAFEGKVVVVEFWATWCGPCVAAIPRMNELAEEFKDEEVVFISITEEDRDEIERFLNRRPIKGLVGIDSDRSTKEAWGYSAIPATFIVCRDGTLLGRTHPDQLTAEHLKRALAGEPMDLPEPRGEVEEVPLHADAEAPEPLVEAWIRPTAYPEGYRTESFGEHHFEMVGAPPKHIVLFAAQLRQFNGGGPYEYEQIFELNLSNEPHDMTVRTVGDDDVADLAWQTIALAFDLEREWGEHERDVLELRRLPNAAPPLAEGFETGDSPVYASDDDTIDLHGAPIEWLRINLGAATKATLVLDETGITQPISVKLDVPAGGPEAALAEWNAALAPHGLRLVEARRVIPFLRVTHRNPTTRPTTGPTTRPPE